MQATAIATDGTTTIEFTNAEAHALRDDLAKLNPGSAAAHTLQRLLSYAHGETQHR